MQQGGGGAGGGGRSQRFPSIEERVKVYMSNWYLPPCSSSSRGTTTTTGRGYDDDDDDDGYIHYAYRENHHHSTNSAQNKKKKKQQWQKNKKNNNSHINKGNNKNNTSDDDDDDDDDRSWPTLLIKVPTTMENNNKNKKQHHPAFRNITAMTMTNGTSTMIEMSSAIEPDMAFFIDRETLLDCATSTTPEEEEEGGESASSSSTSGAARRRWRRRFHDRIKFRKNMYLYCFDVADSLLTALDHVEWEQQLKQIQQQNLRGALSTTTATTTEIQEAQPPLPPPPPSIPILMQFGDLKHSHVYQHLNIPHIKKFRSAARDGYTSIHQITTTNTNTIQQRQQCYDGSKRRRRRREALATVHNNMDDDDDEYDHDDDNIDKNAIDSPPPSSSYRLQPIIWKLATNRHFRLLDNVHQDDTPWHRKLNIAVFRGQLTGSRDGYDKHKNDYENCMNLIRCKLVYKHSNSSLVHAKLTSTRGRISNVLNDVQLVSSSVPIKTLLKYKAIIMLEGNDVASGLKWALLSQSVVLMPPPKHTSWAMEELLQPWVHYIPILENIHNNLDDIDNDDIENKVRWIINNDNKAQQIAQRGTMWIEDLVYHPDSIRDDRIIQEEIIYRYQQHFKYDSNLLLL